MITTAQTPAELALLYPMQGWLHPDLAPHVEGIQAFVTRMVDTAWAIPEVWKLPALERHAVRFVMSLKSHANDRAYSVPLLHPDLCDLLVAYAQEKRELFAVNDDEEGDYQMPELVLQRENEAIYHSILAFAQTTLYPVMNLIWGRKVDRTESIQLAHYSADGINSSGWHLDEDSNMTAVVNLAPELYTGGGTAFRTRLNWGVHVPPVPKGHALVFNGHQTLHHGVSIDSGDRYILVFWCTTGR